MNWLDLIFLLILLFTTVHGLFKGLIKEVASILGLILGILVAQQYYQLVSAKLSHLSVLQPYAWILAYLIIFTAVLLLVIILGKLLRTLLKIGMLGWLDKLAGGMFGFLKGVLISSIIMLALTFVLQSNSLLFKQSALAPFFTDFNQELATLIPRQVKKDYMQKSRELQDIWEEKLQPALNRNQTE